MNNNFEFINGFLAGQLGKSIPPKASEEWLEAYHRGAETARLEKESCHG